MAKARKNKYREARDYMKLGMLAVIIGLTIITLIQAADDAKYKRADIDYPVFEEYLASGQIKSAEITTTSKFFVVETVDGEKYTVVNPGYDEFKKDLLEAGVDVSIRQDTAFSSYMSVFTTAPLMIGMALILYIVAVNMTSSPATLYKVLSPKDKITFDDIAGMSEVKSEVQFAVSQLKNTKKLKQVGAQPCRGIILEGPPGTGKTLIARAIACEADVPFISTNGADFIEMFAGLGAARVRKLWTLALSNTPCVIFIDEIDAVGKRRNGGGDGATTEANQTLNEILSQMDGLSVSSGILVIGATNRIQDLDPALLRPGRFDKKIYVGAPRSKKDRDEIVNLYLKNKRLSEDFDAGAASRLLFGCTGAEIKYILNDAVMESIQAGRDGVITVADVDKASMKYRASGVGVKHSSKEDIRIAAIHEAGHAVMSCLLGRSVSKVSITPYNSGIGGMTIRNVDDVEDVTMTTSTEIKNEIMVLLSGRAAEQIVFGETSVGCTNDIERATNLAYRYLYEFSMQPGRLANPKALADAGFMVTDSNELYDAVNKFLIEINDTTVLPKLRGSLSYIEKLADMLETDENVIDFTLDMVK